MNRTCSVHLCSSEGLQQPQPTKGSVPVTEGQLQLLVSCSERKKASHHTLQARMANACPGFAHIGFERMGLSLGQDETDLSETCHQSNQRGRPLKQTHVGICHFASSGRH